MIFSPCNKFKLGSQTSAGHTFGDLATGALSTPVVQGRWRAVWDIAGVVNTILFSFPFMYKYLFSAPLFKDPGSTSHGAQGMQPSCLCRTDVKTLPGDVDQLPVLRVNGRSTPSQAPRGFPSLPLSSATHFLLFCIIFAIAVT